MGQLWPVRVSFGAPPLARVLARPPTRCAIPAAANAGRVVVNGGRYHIVDAHRTERRSDHDLADATRHLSGQVTGARRVKRGMLRTIRGGGGTPLVGGVDGGVVPPGRGDPPGGRGVGSNGCTRAGPIDPSAGAPDRPQGGRAGSTHRRGGRIDLSAGAPRVYWPPATILPWYSAAISADE
jgi:hypothetical protein